ncbi:MAG: YihY/virulence factor BrkB family protein [Candidatus Dormibacteria bacterium]
MSAATTALAGVRDLTAEILGGFRRNDLLTYSSAISFKILTSVIPFFLFVFALAGLLHLEGLWHHHLEGQVRDHVSPGFYRVIAEAVNKAFGSKQWMWASLGGLLALWQVSGAMRAVMGAFSRIYEATNERSFARRYLVSAGLAIAVGVCFVLASMSMMLAPFLNPAPKPPGWGILVLVARWGLSGVFLLLAVGLLVRIAPATRMPIPWVSLGAILVMISWLVASLTFYLYLTRIASYSSVFGGLASVIVLLAYLYISVTVFLFGIQLDAIARHRSPARKTRTQPRRRTPVPG